MGIQFFEFQSFPINCLSIECLDSRLRGNDESIHTETCTASCLRTCIPSFPRKWESRIAKSPETVLPDKFPHRQT
ncbi:hypothetical protein GC065_08370 [Neisseria meningitidis]|nr:hypothetical protein [Neisseria meningitidis]